MERLTMNNGLCQMASTEFCFSNEDCYSCLHGRKCFKRLAAYEDTGLEPEEITYPAQMKIRFERVVGEEANNCV